MAVPGSDSSATDLLAKKTRGSSWAVYRRILGYAWPYRHKLAVSLLFSLFIVGSLTAVLLSVRLGINLTFYEPEDEPVAQAAAVPSGADGEILPDEDPRDAAARNIRGALNYGPVAWVTGQTERYLGWQPDTWDERFSALVDRARADKMRALTIWCMLLIILTLCSGIARYLQEYYVGIIGAQISLDLADGMYKNLVRQSVGFFESNSSGELMSRFTNDVFMVNRGLAGALAKLMREPFTVAALLTFALYTDVVLTLAGLLGFPPVAGLLIFIGRKVRKSVARSLRKISSMATVVKETIGGITIIKGFNMEAYEVARVKAELDKLRRFLFQMVRLNAVTGPATEFILVCGIVFFLLLAGQRVTRGELGAGDLATLFLALAAMLDPVRKLSVVNNMIQTSVASAERVFEIIDMTPDIVVKDDAHELGPLKESIRFDNVTFRYNDEKEVLKHINIEIRKGELVALVGPSGAGKSTFIKLLPRFYDVTEGAIRIDGHDLRDVTMASLRRHIGIVTQDTVLFAESIRDNIAFGCPEYTDEAVHAAARAANAADFIDILPEKYDTLLGESGFSLSGGQRQRLAIARALIKDPSILILDEATSSLDAESERLIQDALNNFVEGRTVFVIAHRLSTIQRADRILVMRGGEIVEEGTHESLLRENGLYSQLYDTQFGGKDSPE